MGGLVRSAYWIFKVSEMQNVYEGGTSDPMQILQLYDTSSCLRLLTMPQTHRLYDTKFNSFINLLKSVIPIL